MINWNGTKEDAEAITRVCERYEAEYRELNDGQLPRGYERINLDMDLTACHLNGCPMDWEKLLSAPRFDFLHDVGGISRHIDRKTGKLTDCFLPRCASHESRETTNA